MIDSYLSRIDPRTQCPPKRYVLSDRLHLTYALNHPSIFVNYHLDNPDPSIGNCYFAMKVLKSCHVLDHAASLFNFNDSFNVSLSYKLILLFKIIKFCEVQGDKLYVFVFLL